MINTACIIALSIIELHLIYIWFIKDSRMLAIIKRNIKHGAITAFNPENKAVGMMTWGDTCNPFTHIQSPRDAKQYLRKYIEYTSKCNSSIPVDEVCKNVRANLMSYAHHCSPETADRVHNLLVESKMFIIATYESINEANKANNARLMANYKARIT